MKFVAIAFAAVALIASPAGAQTIAVHPGEMVTVRFDNGNAIVERGPAAPISKYEIYVVWRAESQEVPPGVKMVPPVFISQGEGPPDPPKPLADRLQITMRRVPGPKAGSGDNTVLFIANGYSSAFSYHASISANGRSEATDVCDVPQQFMGLEHWPYVIDELDLSDLRLEPASDSVRCQ